MRGACAASVDSVICFPAVAVAPLLSISGGFKRALVDLTVSSADVLEATLRRILDRTPVDWTALSDRTVLIFWVICIASIAAAVPLLSLFHEFQRTLVDLVALGSLTFLTF